MYQAFRTFSLAIVIALGAVLTQTGLASACVIDNTASLSANGYAAQKNLNDPTGGNTGVPFLFARVYGQGQAITFRENPRDLVKSLPAGVLSQPFYWRWGDGTYSIARTPSHTYRRTGTYLILVYPRQPLGDQGSWSPFDRVQIQIVPAGEVWRDNLGQDALDVFSFGFTWGGRSILAVGVLAVGWGFWDDWRRKRRQPISVRASTPAPTPGDR